MKDYRSTKFRISHFKIPIIIFLIGFSIIDFSSCQRNKLWNGFEISEFTFQNRSAIIVFPKNSDSAQNWIWRARFWGLEPQVDVALLEKGFHLVYIDVVDLYGNDSAVNIWNEYYEFITTKYKLNSKVVLEGMSRGALIVYNWASRNVNKVACIYADAPVCDLRSWPGGWGKGSGSKEDWVKCLSAYNLTDSSINGFKGMPIYNSRLIAQAKIPVIHVCGDSDSIVPMEENSDLIERVFKEAGSELHVIVKKGIGHHPHSLENPKPIVDFILSSVKNN